MTTFSQAIDAVLGDFMDRWPVLAGTWNHAIQTALPNQPYTRPDTSVEWMAVSAELDQSVLVEIGNKMFRLNCLATFGYRGVIDGGLARVNEVQEKLLDWAETAQIAGVYLLDQPPQFNRVGPDDDGWFRINAVVPFTADNKRA